MLVKKIYITILPDKELGLPAREFEFVGEMEITNPERAMEWIEKFMAGFFYFEDIFITFEFAKEYNDNL